MESITVDNVSEIINQPEYVFFFYRQMVWSLSKIKPMILELKEETDKIKFYVIDIDENDELCSVKSQVLHICLI